MILPNPADDSSRVADVFTAPNRIGGPRLIQWVLRLQQRVAVLSAAMPTVTHIQLSVGTIRSSVVTVCRNSTAEILREFKQ